MLKRLRTLISGFWLKISFFVLGVGALVWFLVRVIPKPSRAQYPCMKAAFPIASSFVNYLLGLSVFAIVFKKAKQRFQQSRYLLALGFILIGIIAGGVAIFSNSYRVTAKPVSIDMTANQPVGEAKGVLPGRVVWIHNPEATNEDCSETKNDYWYMDENTDPIVVSDMFSKSLQDLTGTTSDAVAWDSIFHYYNRTHGRGDVGYTSGEKIVIKINLNGLSGSYPTDRNINTSPQICYAVLDQLINVVKVTQSDIGIGDPSHDMNTYTYNPLHQSFPNVQYWGSGSGKTALKKTTSKVLFYSDGTGAGEYLPQQYEDATYMINIPVFKKHHRAGISICCKNHVGSISPYSSENYSNAHWHKSLPTPNGAGQNTNGDYGVYRCFVDFMGHKDLGAKTILYLVDGLWGSTNWGHPAVKWQMAPFNDDYPNSLFVSLDPVAIESVCFDLLYYEFDENNPYEGGDITDDKGPFPHMAGVDDYLRQAASSDNWPAGVEYDPENDGVILTSLGTYEHWNNAIDMQYSRNLSSEGKGIELYRSNITSVNTIKNAGSLYSCSNYPNPFTSSTTFKFNLDANSDVLINVYNMKGQKVSSINLGSLTAGDHQYSWKALDSRGLPILRGNYIYTMDISNNAGNFQLSNKMVVAD